MKSQKKILVVEDEYIIANDIKEFLTTAEYKIIGISSSGKEAIKKTKELKPDVVLMDIVLQGEMDGIEAARQIRSRFSVPVIFVTAYSDEDRLTRAKKSCPYGFLTKPINEKDLYIAIEIAIHKSKIDKELQEKEQTYRSMVESYLDPIYLVDKSCRYIFLNEAHLRRFKLPLDQVIGRKYGDFHSKKETARFKSDVDRVFKTRKSVTHEHHSKRDGNDFLRSINPVRGEKRSVDAVVVISKNITVQKKTELALKESETKFRSLMEKTGVGVAATDTKGIFTYVNESLCRMIGYTKEEMLGTPFAQYLHPEEKKKILGIFRMAFQHPMRRRELEFRVIHKNGDVKYWNSSPTIVMVNGKIMGFNALITDITKRKWVERVISREKLLSDSIIENIPAGILFLDNDFILRKCNHVGAELIRAYTPYTPKQALGKSYFDIAPGSRAQVEEWFQKVRDSRQVDTRYGFELVLKRDGQEEISYWDTSVAPVLDIEGKVEGILILTKDVTEHREANEALRESEERFSLAFEKANIGMCLVDVDGRLIQVNSQLCKIFGYNREELESMNVNDIAYPEDLDISPRFIKESVAGKKEHARFEKRYFHKRGHIVWGQVSSSLIKDHQGEPLYFVSHIQDITKFKQMEEAIKGSEKKYRTLFEEALNPIMMADESGRYIDANIAALNFLECDLDELRGKYVWDFTPPAFLERQKREHDPFVGSRTIETEYLIHGTIKTLLLNVMPLEVQGKTIVFGIGQNITERKIMEQDIQKSFNQLRELAAHLQSVREEERSEIAREIHDEFGQALTALRMNIMIIENEIKKIDESGEISILQEEFADTKEIIDKTIQRTREFASELRPEELDILGLIEAIETYIQKIEDKSKIPCEFNSSIKELEIDKNRSIAVYRVVQEAITNVIRHAKATKVSVKIRKRKKELLIEIMDNGVGITEKKLNSMNSYGIRGMKERAIFLNGSFQINTKKGAGTTINFSLPLEEEND